MTSSHDAPEADEIARVAHSLWEAEGRPEGRDHEHWMQAKRLIEEGRAEAEGAPRPVQPGFADASPGTVPEMEDVDGAELEEGPGGRFAKQIADLPEGSRPEGAATADPQSARR